MTMNRCIKLIFLSLKKLCIRLKLNLEAGKMELEHELFFCNKLQFHQAQCNWPILRAKPARIIIKLKAGNISSSRPHVSFLLSIRDARGKCFGGKISPSRRATRQIYFSPKCKCRHVTVYNRPKKRSYHTKWH